MHGRCAGQVGRSAGSMRLSLTTLLLAALCTLGAAQDAEPPGGIDPEQGTECADTIGAACGDTDDLSCCPDLVCDGTACTDCLNAGTSCGADADCCVPGCVDGVCADSDEIVECAAAGNACGGGTECCVNATPALECSADTAVCEEVPPCAAAGDACGGGTECCADATPPLECSAAVCEEVLPCANEDEACSTTADCCPGSDLECLEGTCMLEPECGVAGADCDGDAACCTEVGLTCQEGECDVACAAETESCADTPCCTSGGGLTCQDDVCAPPCVPEDGACSAVAGCCPNKGLVCTEGTCVPDVPCAANGEACFDQLGCCTDGGQTLTCQSGPNGGAATCAPKVDCVNVPEACDETTPCCPDQGAVCLNGACTEEERCAAEGERCTEREGCCNAQGASLTCQDGTCRPPPQCAFAGDACGPAVACCESSSAFCVDGTCKVRGVCIPRDETCGGDGMLDCCQGSCQQGACVNSPPPASGTTVEPKDTTTPPGGAEPQPHDGDDDDSGIGTAAIAGIAAGAVVVILAAALIAVLLKRKQRTSGSSPAAAAAYEADVKASGGGDARGPALGPAGGAGVLGAGTAAATGPPWGPPQGKGAWAPPPTSGSPASSYGTGEIPFYEPTGVEANAAVNPYDAPSTDLPSYANGPDPAYLHQDGSHTRGTQPSRVSSQVYASGAAAFASHASSAQPDGYYGGHSAERAPSDYARNSAGYSYDGAAAAGAAGARHRGSSGAYSGHQTGHAAERVASGDSIPGGRRPSRASLPPAPSGLTYGQSTRGSHGHPDAAHDTRQSTRTNTADWLTVDARVSTVSAPDLRGRLENALDNWSMSGEPFLGRFTLLSAAHRRKGGQGVVQFARGVHDGQEYAVKFFTARNAFECEEALYSNKVLRDMMPAVRHIESNADGSVRSPSGWPVPPCIVIERGESLDKWAERLKPDFPTILQVLCHVTTRLQRLHEAGLAHRDLKPGNVLWRPQHLEWTLIDFGCAAPTGGMANLAFSPRYAAPEVLQAYEAGEKEMAVAASTDIWSLGVMAFELLNDAPAFDRYTPQKDVIAALSGRAALPWEGPGGEGKLRRLRMLQRSITRCLSRDAAERPSAQELLASWEKLFDSLGADATVVPTAAGPVQAASAPAARTLGLSALSEEVTGAVSEDTAAVSRV